MADTEDTIMSWNNYLAESSKIVDKLNSKSIKEMHYKNSLGTDLHIVLPDNHIWCDANKKNIIVNMPSYEKFTSPDYTKTNGIVYSSRPLVYNGKTVDKFFIEFENGKAVNYGAQIGFDILRSIILNYEYSSYLGEAALVNYNSPISNTNKVLGNTLFDENASCHLALGSGFPNCFKNSNGLTKEELRKFGINSSKCHVDFMIGTSDLSITAKTSNNENIVIFEDGNFSKVFVK